MKLTEIYNKPLKEILEECDIVNQQFHTDDNGNVKAIEIKYKPKDKCGPNVHTHVNKL